MGGVEVADEGLEVFHVGAEDEWFGSEDGFGGILASGGKEGFTYDDDIGMASPSGEFAG